MVSFFSCLSCSFPPLLLVIEWIGLVSLCLDIDFILGSSQGRGPRCAGWFQDYILDIARFGRKSALEVRVLKGGIKGWVKDFEGSMMEGFEEEYWEQFQESK